MDLEKIGARLSDFTWWQTIDLGNGLTTPGNPVIRPINDKVLEALRLVSVKGKRVLEIGCRDGLFCFEAERLGAAEVIGIDHILSRGATELLIPALESRVRMFELNLFDLNSDRFGKFDVVIFAGVLYHLRYPFWALRIVRELLNEGGVLVLETAFFRSDDPSPLLYCPIEEESPYEPSSVTFFNERGLRDTLHSIGFRVHTLDWVFDTPSRNARTIFKNGLVHLATGAVRMGQMVGLSPSLIENRFTPRVNAIFHRKQITRGVARCGLAQADPDLQAYWESVPAQPK